MELEQANPGSPLSPVSARPSVDNVFAPRRWIRKLWNEGPIKLLSNRLGWYKRRFQKENWFVGRYVELTGNKVKIRGLRFSVDNPLISTRQKSWMYFQIYELAELDFVEKYIQPTDAVVEVGASIGVVACCINRRLSDRSKHIAVEANPGLIPTLQANRQFNFCDFRIASAAVAYGADCIEFTQAENFLSGRVAGAGAKKVMVPTVTLNTLVEEFAISPITLICDIEGAEIDLVANELPVMRQHVGLIIMETHPAKAGADATVAMLADLKAGGFDLIDERRSVVVLQNRELSRSRPRND
jgi:FkbM family methyltransferase